MATPSEPDRRVVPGAAPAPRRLHPASPILDVSTLGRQLLAPGVVALGAGGVRLLLVGVLVVLAWRVLAWWRRTYLLDGGVLRVESGVLVRSQQLLPCERIQQVHLVQKLRHRMLGVAALEVRTAVGGGGSGVTLEVLDATDAEALRLALLRAKHGAADDDELHSGDRWVPAPWPVVALSYGELAVAGLTGVQLLVVFVFAATALQVAGELSWDPLEGLDVAAFEVLGPVLVAALVVGFLIVWLVTAAAASILTDAGYRLTLTGDELHVVRGLLDRKEATLPLARVQAVRILASAPRRALGLVSLRIQSAGAGSGTEATRVAVPVLRVTDLHRVLALVLPGATLPALHRPPPAALRRALVRRVVPALALALGLTVVIPAWGALWMLAVPAAAGLGLAAYRGLGHALAGEFLIARSGSFNRQTVIVPVGRTQSGTVRTTPFQRRSGLATLSVDLAGPGPSARVPDEAAGTAEALLVGVVGVVADHRPTDAPTSRR